MTATITCLNAYCPERKSVCCGGESIDITQTGDFRCDICHKEFQGGKCTMAEEVLKKVQFMFAIVSEDEVGQTIQLFKSQTQAEEFKEKIK